MVHFSQSKADIRRRQDAMAREEEQQALLRSRMADPDAPAYMPPPSDRLPALPPAPPAHPFFGVLEDIRSGRLPGNATLHRWIQDFFIRDSSASSLGNQSQLSPQGKLLVQDMSELARALDTFLAEKNGDELIQRMVQHMRLASRTAIAQYVSSGGARNGNRLYILDQPDKQVWLETGVGASAKKRRVWEREATAGLRSMSRLMQLLVTSTDFREEVVGRGQSVLKRAIKYTRSREEPPLSSTPAVFLPPVKTTESVVDMSFEELKRRVHETQRNLEDLTLSTTTPRGPTYFQLPTTASSGTTSRTSASTPSSSVPDLVIGEEGKRGRESSPRQQPPYYRSSSASAPETLKTAEVGREPLPSATIPDRQYQSPDQKSGFQGDEGGIQMVPLSQTTSTSTVRPVEVQAAALFLDEPKAILDDLLPVLRILGENGPFRDALEQLMTVFLRYTSTQETAATTASQTTATHGMMSAFTEDANLEAAREDMLELVSRMAGSEGGPSIRPLMSAVQELASRLRRDYALRDTWVDWRAFLARAMTDKAYAGHPEYYQRGRYLLDRTRDLLAHQPPQATPLQQQTRPLSNEPPFSLMVDPYSASENIGQPRARPYGQLFDDIFNHADAVIRGWRSDANTQAIGTSLRRIVRRDLAGGLAQVAVLSDSGLMNDLRYYFLPLIVRNLHDIPLPRVEALYGSGNRITLDGLTLPAQSLTPMNLDIRATSEIRMNPREKLFGRFSPTRTNSGAEEGKAKRRGPTTHDWETGTRFTATHIFADMRNIRYSIRRHKASSSSTSAKRSSRGGGLFRYDDDGLMDLAVGGEQGMRIVADVWAVSPDRFKHTSHHYNSAAPAASKNGLMRMRFGPQYVRVKIDDLRMRLHDSRHPTFNKLMQPFLGRAIKRQLETGIRDRIVRGVEVLDGLMHRASKSIAINPNLPST